MAVDFNGASNFYRLGSQSRVTAAPMTLACFFKAETLSAEQHLISINDYAGDINLFSLGMGLANNDQLDAGTYENGAGWTYAEHATTLSTGTWYHACARYISTSNRWIYLDGLNGVQDATSKTPSNIDNFDIGTQSYLGASQNEFDGLIAEVGVWDIDLTTEEITALAAGVSPLLVRPGNLIWYVPLRSDNGLEYKQGDGWTASSGATSTDHPPMAMHRAQVLQFPPAPAGGTGELIGTSLLDTGATGVMKGAGALGTSDAYGSAVFTASGVMKGAGALIAPSAFQIWTTSAAILLAAADLQADTVSLTLTVPDAVLDGATAGELVGSSSLALAVADAVMKGTGPLVATSDLTITTAANLSTEKKLIGSASVTFTVSDAVLSSGAADALIGTADLTTVAAATMIADAKLIGSTAITFSSSASSTSSGLPLDAWNRNNNPWAFGGTAIGEQLPILVNNNLFYQADSVFLSEETGTVDCFLERVGLPLVAPYVHPSSVKLVTRFWPVIEGTLGDQIEVYLGMQERDSQETPSYLPPQIYTIGTTESVDGEIAGRFACIKLRALNIRPWTITRYQLDWEVIGRN